MSRNGRLFQLTSDNMKRLTHTYHHRPPEISVYKEGLEVTRCLKNVDLNVFVYLSKLLASHFVILVCSMDGKLNVQTEQEKYSVNMKIHNCKKGAETQRYRKKKEKDAKTKRTKKDRLRRESLGESIFTPGMFFITAFQSLISRDLKIRWQTKKGRIFFLKEH